MSPETMWAHLRLEGWECLSDSTAYGLMSPTGVVVYRRYVSTSNDPLRQIEHHAKWRTGLCSEFLVQAKKRRASYPDIVEFFNYIREHHADLA